MVTRRSRSSVFLAQLPLFTIYHSVRGLSGLSNLVALCGWSWSKFYISQAEVLSTSQATYDTLQIRLVREKRQWAVGSRHNSHELKTYAGPARCSSMVRVDIVIANPIDHAPPPASGLIQAPRTRSCGKNARNKATASMIAFVDSLPTLNTSVSFAIGLCTVYVALVYKRWSENFAGRRVKRSVQGSPSHDNLPALRAKAAHDGTNSSEKTPMRRSSSLSFFSDFGEELGGGIAKTLDSEIRDLQAQHSCMQNSEIICSPQHLPVDHVYLSFGNYLWAATFISPFTNLLAARRLFCLRMNTILINRGFISLPSCSYELLAAEICLEQTQVIHFSKSEGTRIAVFLFKNLPYVDDQCKFRVAEELKVEVDLINRSLSMATLDNEILSAEDATILLYFTLIAAIHPQMHSAANWSVNVHESLAKTNPGLLTNSVATVISFYSTHRVPLYPHHPWKLYLVPSLLEVYLPTLGSRALSTACCCCWCPYWEEGTTPPLLGSLAASWQAPVDVGNSLYDGPRWLYRLRMSMTWQCGKSSGVAGAGQRWASSEVEFGLEVAVAVGSACSIAVIVVAGCSLLIELARQVRESLRVALRRSCPAVMIWRDLLFTPKEGHHKPVKIENPRSVAQH
ncbi:hypothetical protein THAOC_13544 [Thalassiosira oceanica]|uniref:Uncharacterized protein n=1 Tax=Thalassiosira oceanica TaxID=159749 RepID=K0SHD0_THAOC|nr:hypothetical protein THAOC_13544 [Thalassiosira oceanica]|eukprot:EJK65578.1 hypothetical protein THAOC_13544 [Thalassiosira oceanica]